MLFSCFPSEKSVTLALKPVIVLPLGQAAQNELAGCHGNLPGDGARLFISGQCVCVRARVLQLEGAIKQHTRLSAAAERRKKQASIL